LPLFRRLLGSGNQWGLEFTYAEQAEPRGVADAFLVGEDFIAGEPVCLIFGDNLFYGTGFSQTLRECSQLKEGAIVFAYAVRDPQRYGVVEFDEQGHALSIVEKPQHPRSDYAVPGMYFYDHHVVESACQLKPSGRNELEITDLNMMYLEKGQLQVKVMGRGIAWLDAGTPESLLQAANFVQAVEERQGLMIACPEEIAYHLGYIGKEELSALALSIKNSYGDYLLRLVKDQSSIFTY
jgi:glucose-1-phosphate thymidylyltransferase